MKCSFSMKWPACLVCLALSILPACKKNVSPAEPGRPGTGNLADTLSAHLRFLQSTKKPGSIPHGISGASLQISFQDTLYLVDAILRPIKFLHDKSADVAGVYIQARLSGGSTAASFFYDVPEIKEMADNDTISVIMIGVEPSGLEPPIGFDLTITPYNDKGQPLAEATRPVRIDKPENAPHGNGNNCGLVLPAGDRWEWEMSFIMGNNNNGEFAFYNQPGKVFSAQGQNIEGSCCNGFSKWPDFCAGEKKHNRTLKFATYYKIDFETIRFFSDGSFLRQTMEDSPVPIPEESDFCSGVAKVRASRKHTVYEGDWTVSPVKLPPDLSLLAKLDTLQLQMRGTSTSGTGYGNPGGVIHQLDCGSGFLTLIQLDREGRKHLYKFYGRKKQGEPLWFPFG